MASCLTCASTATVGLLCSRHAVRLAAPGMTSEQLLSSIDAGEVSLVDAWGCPHALTDGATIGRDRAAGLAILHPSVSQRHATIRKVDGRWRLIDHDSRNGIEVDGKRGSELDLPAGAVVRLGDAQFEFHPAALPKQEPPRGRGRTAGTSSRDLAFNATFVTPAGDPCEMRQRIDGGLVRVANQSFELAAMEFGLLQTLVIRRRAVNDPDLAYVAWHELTEALSFRSVDADSENVRELVHRVRRKLAGANAGDLIESRRGIGYRLAGQVA